MQVKVLAFGVLKDLLGTATEEIELPPASRVADLLRILEQRTSNLGMTTSVWQSLAVAVNREYSSVATELHEADEVALLPPVSGGRRSPGGRDVR
jgi:molybdopterin converting factor small subunit